MTLPTRDDFGLRRLYYTPDRHAPTCRALFDADPALSRALDATTIAAIAEGRSLPERTAFATIRAVPPGHGLATGPTGLAVYPTAMTTCEGDLGALLDAAIDDMLATAPRPLAVALSGGLDSALVLALVRRRDPTIRGLVLDPRLPDYSELDAARETARALDVPVDVVSVDPDAFVAAVPAAIAAFETPLYNLHPVAKWLLADAARRAGYRTLLTGDGADQVMTRDVSADYLPLVGAAFDAHGVGLWSPFLVAGVVAHLLAIAPDRNKRVLRDVASLLPIPRPLVDEPKRGRLAPPLSLDRVVSPSRVAALAVSLGQPAPDPHDDRAVVAWSTAAILADSFGVPP